MSKGIRETKSFLPSPLPKRCIKRFSLKLNRGKWEKLLSVVGAMAAQKNEFLKLYEDELPQFPTSFFREKRNQLVKAKYKSPFGLQARLWKLALKEAVHTLHRYWQSLVARISKRIVYHKELSFLEKKYCHGVLSRLSRIEEVCRGEVPLISGIELEEEKVKSLCSMLKSEWEKEARPRVHLSRSFPGEPETYRIFTHQGRQYISLTTLEARNRVVIPLSGHGKIVKEICLVLDKDRRRLEVHWSLEVKAKKAQGAALGIDIGVSEVLVDSSGTRYGLEFGKLLEKASEERKEKGQRRNKLHALEKKYKEEAGEPGKEVKNHGAKKKKRKKGEKQAHKKRMSQRKARKKWKKIRKHNLGRKKARAQTRRRKVRLQEEVNRALNQVLSGKEPHVFVCEDLSHFTIQCKNKKYSRLLSSWIKGVIRARIDFKCPQGGSLVKRVNPAYSSQICPVCGWVEGKNRNGDVFACCFCGERGYSDEFAAKELLRRLKEPSIFLWTQKEEVKALLLKRFSRRLESWSFPFPPSSIEEEKKKKIREMLATVPGKTPDP